MIRWFYFEFNEKFSFRGRLEHLPFWNFKLWFLKFQVDCRIQHILLFNWRNFGEFKSFRWIYFEFNVKIWIIQLNKVDGSVLKSLVYFHKNVIERFYALNGQFVSCRYLIRKRMLFPHWIPPASNETMGLCSKHRSTDLHDIVPQSDEWIKFK